MHIILSLYCNYVLGVYLLLEHGDKYCTQKIQKVDLKHLLFSSHAMDVETKSRVGTSLKIVLEKRYEAIV